MDVFITGTDTGCGKTYVTAALLRRLASHGLRVAGMKPVATGCKRRAGRLWNEDVEAIAGAANLELPREIVNPYLFEPPCSPHIAAAGAGTAISLDTIAAAYRRCRAAADIVVVEGVGGWAVPLSSEADVAALVETLELPVVLVVGVKLGAINHALLTADAILARGARCIGWVANHIDTDLHAEDEVLATLESSLPFELLDRVERGQDPELPNLVARVAGPDARPTR